MSEPVIQHQFSKAAPYPEVPKNLFSPSLEVSHIGEIELARQFTILDFQLFAKIKVPSHHSPPPPPTTTLTTHYYHPPQHSPTTTYAREFYFYGHDKARAPNVVVMYDRFRMMSKWVADEISRRAKLKHRVKLVKRFISLAGVHAQIILPPNISKGVISNNLFIYQISIC